MPATPTEKHLSRRMNPKGILVPLLEDLFMRPVEIENQPDVDFVTELLKKQVRREEARRLQGYYSPSALASCLRQVYLSRHWQELQLKKLKSTKIEPHYYFATGDWLHMKWQFALYKLDQEVDDSIFQLYDVEVPVVSKHGDHGGTIDAIAAIHGQCVTIDCKGVNVRTFKDAQMNKVPINYQIQLADYMMLVNSDRAHKIPRIENGILLFENKGGPTPGNPLALHESMVLLKDFLPEIRYRLEELRKHEAEKSIPKPACKSIRETQFLGCPFRDYCKREVKAKSENSNSKGHRIAVPEKRRANRSRRNTK